MIILTVAYLLRRFNVRSRLNSLMLIKKVPSFEAV